MLVFASANPPADAVNSLSQMLAPIIMVAGIVTIAVILTISIRGKIARRNAARPDPRDAITDARARAETRNALDVQKAELLQTTQDLASRLATRARQLELLIDEADQRIATLRSVTPGIPDPSEASSMESTAPPMPASPSIDVAEPTEPAPAPQPPAGPTQPAPPLDPLTESVYSLSDAGCNPVEIAGKLDEQIGKVELILALRRSG